MINMVTVFTPTYNRAHLLPRLFKSLQSQTCFDFEWLIVDDGSTDNTEVVVQTWIESEQRFPIRYYKVDNGGKMRAINYGAKKAKGEYFCGIDSDDWFTSDAIETIIDAFKGIKSVDDIIGVSFSKAFTDGRPLSTNHLIESAFIDCANNERINYGLSADMIQIFYTESMRVYEIPVWHDEKFTPESVFLDKMSVDGKKNRYFKKIIYQGEYLEGGLSDGTWRLLRNNLMGYAMMFNMKLNFQKGIKQRIITILQFISCCSLKGEYRYIMRCNSKIGAILLFIPGYLLSLRRKKQFEKYC